MNKNEQVLIDVKRQKAYKGSSQDIIYEKFEDTIKHFPYEIWKVFIQFVKELEDKNRKRNKIIFQTLLSTGMRINEFSLIKVAGLNFNEGVLNIPAENTKSKKRRVVRLNKALSNDIKDYIFDNNIKSGYVFRNRYNKAFSVRFYQKLTDKYFLHPEFIKLLESKKLALEFKPHPHTFRHCHCIYSLEQGVPINTLQQQVGHVDLRTTQIYLKLAGVEIKKGYVNVEF